jgi:hypothetical protein
MSLEPTDNAPSLPRLFLFEPGWRITRKSSSEREFCHSITPGQDYYHRLLDGEIYLHKADEKVCLPCAARRGLLTYDPKLLREPIAGVNVAIDELLDDGFEVLPGDHDSYD